MRHRVLMIYAGLVVLLLLQFFLRSHHITELPFFWDENRHMVRAADVVDGVHPAKNSNGKFLLYLYLAPFHPERSVALHVSRTAVALFSLLGSAAMVALMRRLFGLGAAFWALAFYALVPFALFYERMALADPMAGALMVLTAYASVRMAQHPTYRVAIVAGALASMATMAKVTVTFAAVAMPVLAAYSLGNHPQSSGQSTFQWMVARWRRYWWFWVAAGLSYLILWLPTVIPAFVSGLQGDDYVLIDQTSIDTSFLSENDEVRYDEFPNQIITMLSLGMTLFLMSGIVLGLRCFPRRAILLVGWVALVWGPTAILVWRTQTRYLMAAVFPLAMLFGAALIHLITLIPETLYYRRMAWAGAFGAFALWAVLFAVPFANNAANHAENLEVTRWDNRDYYQSPWNGYALIESLDYLQTNGDPGADQVVNVVSVSQMCPFMDLYAFPDTSLTCISSENERRDYDGTPGGVQWQRAIDIIFSIDEPLYFMIEQHRRTFVIPEIPYVHPDLAWQQMAAFQRPKGGLWVTIWAVERVDS